MMFDTTVKKIGILLTSTLWLLLALSTTVAAQSGDEPLEVTDIRICNLRGNTFTITWRTNKPTNNNIIKLGLAPDQLSEIREDNLNTPSHIHYVETGLLDVAKTYYYQVSSDGAVGASSPVGYDSVLTQDQLLPSLGAMIHGGIVDSASGEPLSDVIVRSYYRWSRSVSSGIEVDSTMWMAVLTDSDGDFDMQMGNYRRYNGSNPPYYNGSTWLFLEILSQTTGAVVSDSVLLTFPYNATGQYQILQAIEVVSEIIATPGDVDGNGAINIFDVLDILKVIGGQVTPDEQKKAAADMDVNGKIDIFDLLEILKQLRPADTASG